MATIGGFEIETPQEVQARIQAQIERLRSQNPEAANSQVVINALFGNPELRAAQEKQKQLSTALSSVKKAADESEIEFQMRQQQAVRERMANVDPSLSIQANENLIRLQAEQVELESAGLSRDKKKEDLAETLYVNTQKKRPVIFKFKDGVAIPLPGNYETIEEARAALEAKQAADPTGQYDIGNGLDALKLDDPNAGKTLGGLNRSAKTKYMATITANTRLSRKLGIVADKVAKDPLSLSSVNEQLAEGGDLVNSVAKVFGDFLSDSEEVVRGDKSILDVANEDAALVDAKLATPGVLRRLQEEGGFGSEVRATVTELAYTLAKALDPGGRLSDQDVEMAIEMLTGNGDPNVVLALFEERLAEARNDTATAFDYAINGHLDGDIGIQAMNRFTKAQEEAAEALLRLNEELRARGLKRREARRVTDTPEDERLEINPAEVARSTGEALGAAAASGNQNLPQAPGQANREDIQAVLDAGSAGADVVGTLIDLFSAAGRPTGG